MGREDVLRILSEHRDAPPVEAFCADDRTVDAVVRDLEIIGEAARQLLRTEWRTEFSTTCFMEVLP